VRYGRHGLAVLRYADVDERMFAHPGAEPRPDDIFALAFLARGAVVRENQDAKELPIVAVETVSTALIGPTVGCATCHDHQYDPITQKDFLQVKA
jgi:hypothetical protein